jgi:hypothetical protein
MVGIHQMEVFFFLALGLESSLPDPVLSSSNPEPTSSNLASSLPNLVIFSVLEVILYRKC